MDKTSFRFVDKTSRVLPYLYEICHVNGEVGEVAHGESQNAVGHNRGADVDIDLQGTEILL